MISAITSLVGKTVDVFLKINSSEARRRKFAKDIFGVYKGLDEVIQSLNDIEATVRQIAKIDEESSLWMLGRGGYPEYFRVRSWSSEGTVEIQTLYLDKDGVEKLSAPREDETR
jgi:hypothetical protein